MELLLQLFYDLLLLFIIALATIYGYFHYAYTFWEKRKFPFIPPKFPRGNNPWLVAKTSSFGMETLHYYKKMKKSGFKFAGIYKIIKPVLVVIDPDYIKDILSKDFHHFVDRGMYYNEKDEPINANLFNMDEKKWKNLRIKLTPTFTSGKMKMMFGSILKVSEYLSDAIENCSEHHEDFDIREFLARFTTDVIGTCAFGIDCNSFKDAHSEFRRKGDSIFQYHGILHTIELFLIANFPELARKLGLRFLPSEVSDFFSDLVRNTVEYREKNNFYRPDFLQLLIQLKQSSESSADSFTFNQVASNVFLFFIAGFDTSSTTMNFTLYELCKHPDIQEKVRKEINDVLDRHNGMVTYESLAEMKYMSQVIDEAQRLYPPLVNLTRKCTSDYTLRGTDLTLEKGVTVVIPIMAIQRDPDYYPEPEEFDPERFNNENKNSRHPYLHLPFGEGPRNCIGLRFGVMQSKIGLITILRKFRLKISPSTNMPLQLEPHFLLLKARNKLYLTAEKI